MNLRDFFGKTLDEEATLRRQALETATQTDLSALANVVDEVWKGKNIENAIGMISLPVGVAGPVSYSYDQVDYTQYLPLATTEGALVASISRGCKAITQSGGAEVFVEDKGITRGPVFQTKSLAESMQLKAWLEDHWVPLQELVATRHSRVRLVNHAVFVSGNQVFIRLGFNTGEAMGMNLATLASQTVVTYIEKEAIVVCVALSENVCSDKKASAANWILGRGKTVWAQVFLSAEVVEDVLKTTVRDFLSVYHSKTVMGSAVAGSQAFNAHAANAVAGLFLATGQDLAHVTHASNALLECVAYAGGIMVSIYLPDLPVGTVGGGTRGPTQQACLRLLGLDQVVAGDAKRLTAVIGVAVLAGEISLHAALACHHLAQSHRNLGRGGADA